MKEEFMSMLLCNYGISIACSVFAEIHIDENSLTWGTQFLALGKNRFCFCVMLCRDLVSFTIRHITAVHTAFIFAFKFYLNKILYDILCYNNIYLCTKLPLFIHN